MRVTVTDLYSDQDQEYLGEPEQVLEQLEAAYPWLGKKGDLDEVLEHLNATQGYAAVVDNLNFRDEADGSTWAEDDQPAMQDLSKGFEAELATFLAKATSHDDFTSVVKDRDPVGPTLVDHRTQMGIHPPEMSPSIEKYQQNVIDGPENHHVPSRLAGITGKAVYEVGDQKYLLKPYHGYAPQQTHPIQGWAEMTNQALYHAAGIGHLHQKVHVSEHNMAPDMPAEPALVIHMEKAEPLATLRRPSYSDKDREDARRISFMDFVTDNADRHGYNLLKKNDGGLLAIDHGRSFLYDPSTSGAWEFARYRMGGATNRVISSDKDQYQETGNWWRNVHPRVREAFKAQVANIKDPKLRDHMQRNFDERADWLEKNL